MLVKQYEFSNFLTSLSECTSDYDCTEDNKNTCKDNVCVCNSGFILAGDCCIVDDFDPGCFKTPCFADGLDGICRGNFSNLSIYN